MDCKHYGGVKASNGKYICKNPMNRFTHPVDGMPHVCDASWLRMAPEFQQIGCGMAAHWWEAKEER
jgi:hypothetical protein